jgi:hypothetical protein
MDPLVIPIVAILMPLILAPTVIFMAHRQKRREWEHLERVRSLESGVPTPWRNESAGSTAIAAIGAGVPIASVLAAFLTCISVEVRSEDEIPMAGIAWGCALMISAAAMITSLILALMQLRARKQADLATSQIDKPFAYDPDAYDVVSTRG